MPHWQSQRCKVLGSITSKRQQSVRETRVMIGAPFASSEKHNNRQGMIYPGKEKTTFYKEEKQHKEEAIDDTQQRELSCFEALSAVIIAGPILVLPAPLRPVLDQS